MKTTALLLIVLAAASGVSAHDFETSLRLLELESITVTRTEPSPIFAVVPGAFDRPALADLLIDLRPFARELASLCDQVCASPKAADFLPDSVLRPSCRVVTLVHAGLTLRNDRGCRIAVLVGRTGDFSHLTQRARWNVRVAVNW